MKVFDWVTLFVGCFNLLIVVTSYIGYARTIHGLPDKLHHKVKYKGGFNVMMVVLCVAILAYRLGG